MTSQIRINSHILPVLLVIVFMMQLLDPSRVWAVLFVGLGLSWLSCYLWVRVLAHNLIRKREMRFGWAQVGDRLEQRFMIKSGESTLLHRLPSRCLHFSVGLSVISNIIPESDLELYWIE